MRKLMLYVLVCLAVVGSVQFVTMDQALAGKGGTHGNGGTKIPK